MEAPGAEKRDERVAGGLGCTPAQLSLAWVLHRAPHVHVIPGTTSAAHVVENFGALDVELDDAVMAELDELINVTTVSGARYSAAAQADIDTELLPGEPLA